MITRKYGKRKITYSKGCRLMLSLEIFLSIVEPLVLAVVDINNILGEVVEFSFVTVALVARTFETIAVGPDGLSVDDL